jgi:CreA protein
MRTRLPLIISCILGCLAVGTARAEEIGRFSNDWTGNGMVVEAFADPKVAGVTCHLVRFDRSVIDRLTKGKWFENPSNSAISCERTGPIVVGKIAAGPRGEEVFAERLSLFFKSMAVRRIYDRKNDTLVYVAYSRQVKDASAKMALATVALFGGDVSWAGVKP